VNNLHSEYELKQLTVQAIADLHNRTVFGVLNKLQSEGLIDEKWSDARGYQAVPVLSLKHPIELEDDTDVPDDDPNDEDYVPNDESDADDDEESEVDDEEFDPYSLKQKVDFIDKQISGIYKFLQSKFHLQKGVLP